jgi:hypothetical protein|tara:strand:- start:282 stop:623 length:342 start_codon:yes stop_codon:yes gene_type:complete
MGFDIPKLMGAFKNLDQVAEGLKNNIFKKDHVEAVATERFKICIQCSLYDATGENCAAGSATKPCCSDCGCSLSLKVRSLSSECPKGFWEAVIPDKEIEVSVLKQIEKNENTN